MQFSIVLCLLAGAVVSAEPPRFGSARFRFQRQELALSTTEEPTTEASGDGAYPPAVSAPYPPSGWKPSGQAFTLPGEQPAIDTAAKQDSAPTDSYGAPAKQNSAPSDSYGAPAKQDSATSDSYGAPAKQESGPYQPSGWKPSGQAFTLPARQEAQAPPATGYGAPDSSYGTPDSEYGAPSTESDAATTAGAPTGNPQAANQRVEVQRSEGTYYLLLPNGQLQKVEFATEEDPRNMAYSARLQYPVKNQGPLFLFNP